MGSAHLNKATTVTIIIRATTETLGSNPATVSLLCASGTLRSRGGLQAVARATSKLPAVGCDPRAWTNRPSGRKISPLGTHY